MRLKTASYMARQALRGLARTGLALDIPPPAAPDTSDLARRIRESFRAMKAAAAPDWCRPGPTWQAQLDVAFAALRDDRFGYFLANFGLWPIYTGIEEAGYQIARLGRFLLGRKYIEETFFRGTLVAWERSGRDLAKLALPRHGNQAGAIYRGQFVSCGAPFTDLTAERIGKLLPVGRPVVAELGAGYGKLAYCVLRELPSFCYVDFDLPETLCTAAYYLGKAFPDARLLLYGEAEFMPSSLERFDLIFMPGWEIEKLVARSVDVFLNKNSLGEMLPATTNAYLAHIARATRGHFFHLNHDRVRCDGGLLASEYDVAMRLIGREPDLGHVLVGADEPDIFQYLYVAH